MTRGVSLQERAERRKFLSHWKYGHEFTADEQLYLIERNRHAGLRVDMQTDRFFVRFDRNLSRLHWRALHPTVT